MMLFYMYTKNRYLSFSHFIDGQTKSIPPKGCRPPFAKLKPPSSGNVRWSWAFEASRRKRPGLWLMATPKGGVGWVSVSNENGPNPSWGVKLVLQKDNFFLFWWIRRWLIFLLIFAGHWTGKSKGFHQCRSFAPPFFASSAIGGGCMCFVDVPTELTHSVKANETALKLQWNQLFLVNLGTTLIEHQKLSQSFHWAAPCVFGKCSHLRRLECGVDLQMFCF